MPLPHLLSTRDARKLPKGPPSNDPQAQRGSRRPLGCLLRNRRGKNAPGGRGDILYWWKCVVLLVIGVHLGREKKLLNVAQTLDLLPFVLCFGESGQKAGRPR